MTANNHKSFLDNFAKFLIFLSFFIFVIGFSYDSFSKKSNEKYKTKNEVVDDGSSISITTTNENPTNPIDDSNGDTIIFSNTWFRNLSYNITGDYDKIIWYQIKNAQVQALNNSNNTIYKINSTSAKNLYDVYNNVSFYCEVIDFYNPNIVYSSKNNPITISIIQKPSRI